MSELGGILFLWFVLCVATALGYFIGAKFQVDKFDREREHLEGLLLRYRMKTQELEKLFGPDNGKPGKVSLLNVQTGEMLEMLRPGEADPRD